MSTVILLRRVFEADLNEFTTQWREFSFNTLDPDGPILENLVINSTAFELADTSLVWTNPENGDQYFYNSPNAVNKVAGSGPVIPPPLPDLSDPYGLLYVHEFLDWDQRTCRFEIYRRDYVGADEEIDGSDTNLNFSYENEGKVFVPFRGSMASLTLTSQVSKKFHDIFEADERDHYGRFVRDAVVLWTGWITPDIFSEPYSNPPYRTTLAFNDGIGGLKNLPFPDVNDNGFTGLISEKDAIVACLSRIGLRLDIHIACNIREEKMDTLSAPIEQSMVNVEAFVDLKEGESQPLDCYLVMEKVLTSWNAFILQEDNVWWIVREPELYADVLNYKRFDADGLALGVATKNLNKTFLGEGIKLHRANLETKPAFTNVAVSQEYGELLVENGNFAINGDLEKWRALFINSVVRGWILQDWTYDKLNYYPYTSPTTLGRVRRVTDSVGLDEKNNYINIYEVVRSFSDPVGRLISKPFPIKQEVGNQLQVTFKTRCNTKGSDKRLVEAYFNIAVQVGTKWLAVNSGTGEYEWVGVETRLRWKVAEVMRWENIITPAMPIPEDGDVRVYLYQIVQVGSVSKVEYVCDFDDIEIKLVDNPALNNEKIFYKTNNPETYTSTLEELTIQLGDVATVMSQNAKIIDGEPSSRWSRPGDATAVPLAQLICRELANQYQRTTYRLKSGNFYSDASRLTNYEDTANEPDRRFLLSGGDWNPKKGEWNPDFIEINQTETDVEIRVVLLPKSGRNSNTGSNSGGGPDATGSDQPTPPAVPVDLGDLDDVIPIIRNGVFEDSEIRAIRDEEEEIIQYQFDKPVRGLPATDPDEFVTLSQLPTVQQYGRISGGAIQWSGSGLTYNFARAILGINGEVKADSGQVTLDPADATEPRFDGLGWEKISELIADRIKITGIPSATPAFPSFNPETQVEGIFVLVPALATTPVGVTTENVYLENTEWAVSFSGIGTGNADSTVNPKDGTKAIETSAQRNAFKIILDRGSVLDLNTFTEPTLGWDQALKSTLANNQNFDIIFLDGSGNAASNLLQVALNKASTAYQFIGINLDAFTFTTKLIRYIEIRYRQNGSGTFNGAFFDNIKIQGGVEQPVQSSVKHDSTTEKKGGDPVLGEWYHVTKNRAEGLEASGATAADPVAKMSDLPTPGISDAPSDGGHYARKDASWVAFTPFAHAPSDGNYYASRNGAWTSFVPFTVAGTPSPGDVVTDVDGVPTWQAPSGGGGSNWTDPGTGFIYRNGPVVIGDTAWSNSTALTVKGNSSGSSWVLKVVDSAGSNLIALLNDRRLWFYSDQISIGNNAGITTGVSIKSFYNGSQNIFRLLDNADSILFNMNANGQFFFKSDRFNLGGSTASASTGMTIKVPGTGFTKGLEIQDSAQNIMTVLYANGSIVSNGVRHGFGISAGIITNGSHFKGSGTGTAEIFVIQNGSDQRAFEVRGNRQILLAGVYAQTTDPLIQNALWNDGGTLKISAG